MKRSLIILIIVLFIFNAILVFSPTRNYINYLYVSVSEFFQGVGESFENFTGSFQESWKLEEENSKLQEDNEELKNELVKARLENEELKEDNANYAKSLEIKNNEYKEGVMSNVLYRKVNNSQNIIVIDKGSEDGIKENQVVAYDRQMIGYILNVDASTSDIMLLANDNIRFNIPVKIKNGDKYINAMIESYSYEEDALVVSTLLETDSAGISNRVYTNGYGENQVSDIFVGEITKIDESESNKKYYVSMAKTNFEYVEVLTNEN